MTEREFAQARRRDLCRQRKALQELLAGVNGELAAIERYLGCAPAPVPLDAGRGTTTLAPTFAVAVVAGGLDAMGE